MTVGSPGCQGVVGEKRNACGISTQSARGGPGDWGEWRLCLTPHSLHCPRASLPGSLAGPLHHETEETWANGRVRGSRRGGVSCTRSVAFSSIPREWPWHTRVLPLGRSHPRPSLHKGMLCRTLLLKHEQFFPLSLCPSNQRGCLPFPPGRV